MPGKSRHGKGKRSFQSQKKKGGLSRPIMPAQGTAPTQTREASPSPGVSIPSVRVPPSVAKPVAVRYPYVATELRTIGILAGTMLIILIVLYFVWH